MTTTSMPSTTASVARGPAAGGSAARAGLRRVLAVLGAVAAALSGAAAQAGTITGSVGLREPAEIPAGAVLEVQLADIARADAPARLVATTRLAPAGAPPYRFSLAFDDAAIEPRGRYAVSATLRHEGRLLYRTDTIVSVLRGGASDLPAPLALSMVRVGGGPSAPPALAGLAPLPASFVGELPAADGVGVRWQLDLAPGGAFQLRRTHLGRPDPASFDDIGMVRPDRDGRRFELVGTNAEPVWFERLDAHTLRKLDLQGRPIESTHPDRLRRANEAAPIEPRVGLTGTFTYLADAPRLRLCPDGRSLPVAMEGDYRLLERIYTETRRQPGEPILAELDVTIAMRPPMEGPRPVPTVVVERFVALWPGETCGTPLATASLANTYWKLTRLDGRAVQPAPRQREPHLTLRPDGRLRGFGGCNRLDGRYEHAAGAQVLQFRAVASTKAACEEGMELETTLLETLARVTRYRLRGSHLDLLDASGAAVARLEAVYLR